MTSQLICATHPMTVGSTLRLTPCVPSTSTALSTPSCTALEVYTSESNSPYSSSHAKTGAASEEPGEGWCGESSGRVSLILSKAGMLNDNNNNDNNNR